MKYDIEALKALMAKVEAESLWRGDVQSIVNLGLSKDLIFQAHHGSLDAAKALHEAVLPDHSWSLYKEDSGEFLSMVSKGSSVKIYEEEWHTDPARAWLIAIIKALIAEGQTS